MKRINALRNAFSTDKLDGYLVFNGTNQLYFLGVPGTSALLVPAQGECTVYVYGVNYEQAKAAVKGVNVERVRADENLMAKISEKAADYNVQRLAVDSLTVQSWNALAKALRGKAKVKVDGSHIIALRLVKDKDEVALMRRAGELTSVGMEAACEAVKPGVKEYEVAAEAEYAMRKRGAGSAAFETIVASGVSSAFPHGGCSDREILPGDFVVVDIGATYQYYCSDMTRTFVAGKPSAKQQKIFDAVKAAQQKALEAIKAGAVLGEVDASARRLISEAGYGDFFVHRLGHGVGLEVHEPPSIGPAGKEKLPEGCVVTDEPGVYIPSFGGVRIEDTVLVKRNGAEKLTAGPYSLNPE